MDNLHSLLSQKYDILAQNIFMTSFNLQGNIIEISDAYLKFTGYTKEELTHHKILPNYNLDASNSSHLLDILENSTEYKSEIKNTKISGEEYWVQAVISPLYDKNNIKIAYIAILKDITDQKYLEHLIEENSFINVNENTQEKEEAITRDLITKLPNRAVLVHEITYLKEDAMLILLNVQQIDTLKNLYGYEFTASVMSQKAQQLQSIIRDDEVLLCSLNLQEFAILVKNKKLFEKYFLLLQHSILINNDYYTNKFDRYISANFVAGIAYGKENIFNNANLVLQEALSSNTNYKVHHNNQTTIQLKEESFKRLQVYKNALHKDNIIPYFQPIVDSKTSKIIKYEALARLQLDDGSVVSPNLFLDSAQEDQSFEFFTRQMMQKVFNIYAKNNINISMNLSYQNITSPTMVQYILNRLEKYGGKGITFEIVESEDIKSYEVLADFISIVREYGAEISIDDFGSGYSNFTNIVQLDIDYIKLDGSLIKRLNHDTNIKNMIKGLILYAKNAKIKTIAEFVTTHELAQTVKELEIDYSQGYYYGAPQNAFYYDLI